MMNEIYNTSEIVIEKTLESSDGTKTNYAYVEDPSGASSLRNYEIKDKDMFFIYEWFEDKFTAMDGTYKDKVTPINDYYYIDSYKGEKIICDLCGGSYSGLDEVYFGNEITNIIGNKNVVLAVQTLKSDDTDLVEDTVIYGLELGSFKMVTPIWSRLQQRAIPIYTKEHANIMKRKTGCIGAPDDVTFYCEIFKTMNDLADNYLPVEEPTSDDYDINAMVDDTIVDEKGKVNKEFVKKFTITPVSNK